MPESPQPESQPQPESVHLAQQVAARLAEFATDVVLCPGSRNAPLSLALIAHPGLRVHVRLDERSAAFLALGLARVQQRHVAVVMTSGSAVSNCLPAVVEASHSHTPLVVLSADRPQRLVGTGASQTIQQQGIFSTFTDTTQINTAADLPAFSDRLNSDRLAHINVAFDVPLVGSELAEPSTDVLADAHPADAQVADAPAISPADPAHPARRRLPSWSDHGEVAVDLSKPTLVIAGDEAWRVDGLEDVPTIAEPSAPAPYVPVHPGAAAIFAKDDAHVGDYYVRTKPAQVIVVGHPTLHRRVLALITDPDIEVIVLSRTDDFLSLRTHSAQETRGTRVKTTGEPTREWLKVCQAASDLAAGAVRDALEDESHGFTGLHVAAAVTDTLAVGDTVFVGPSNPVRDVALTGLPFDGVDTYSPRGAAGIDGNISQAMGVAIAAQSLRADEVRAPRTVALLGDITFLHDVGGLLRGVDQPEPENLTIVVANDDGGGIFESLEVGQPGLRRDFEQAFGTPHGVDIAAICEGYGLSYQRAESPQELLDALAAQTEFPEPILVIEAATTRTTRRQLHQAIDTVLGG
ncbi:2-succinyl-5-enolpyruvyl-6-hydroxy-3-cyclohexene-1-carboxylic-acid synthase [Corynebacterium propinquum]|uniref:2-succinyl-5-enolpyruvyl-6-hydroxy-3-cyclohexene-1-carboxylate synthase n=2 Tax=Corynebacterium propinquum TaxID=43769 RepID=A0AAP4F755_9CORY|nr:2-succinyl-5-enolpyruvyl-6-hydroxy-3-cyclohexene-1-carboxylic-acid synthase [Corynebacterium propinquum]MDK4326977.1 2-succinyl-5-enolpyruvyl-6-hydroxy-3-cyclohexene-1-carboxylic-acid synthase [Corynebacterium propinquum]MDK8723779.1 2-succinyl-5-enolpyruvyl-6-hydroxy-3-cyclohexene-1-carboxylic-acid synthase [Corynebacterium propinquum]UQV59981.1 2-succinyl-5-enolpyruvyl-6-hydroxy-3-cyclohexene-1-carboxylic-acid synthase [Corynebacterium propinquum]